MRGDVYFFSRFFFFSRETICRERERSRGDMQRGGRVMQRIERLSDRSHVIECGDDCTRSPAV